MAEVVIAPDGSEVRLLARTKRGNMTHCTLAPGAISKAVRHRTVDELWYCLAGAGQMWRRFGEDEVLVDVQPGLSLNLPVGTVFQFRNPGAEPLEFVIVTLPPWPGEDEAVPAPGYWE